MARVRKSDAKRAYDRELGHRIARARRLRGLTQRELAVAIGVSASFLGMIEIGGASCSMFLFEKIQGVLRGARHMVAQ